ncbi:MAG: hypothetical protein WCG00_15685 [Hyphomicrobiales bacterium]
MRGHSVLARDEGKTGYPDANLMEFLQSTDDAAADPAKWDRKALGCAVGEAERLRPV